MVGMETVDIIETFDGYSDGEHYTSPEDQMNAFIGSKQEIRQGCKVLQFVIEYPSDAPMRRSITATFRLEMI